MHCTLCGCGWVIAFNCTALVQSTVVYLRRGTHLRTPSSLALTLTLITIFLETGSKCYFLKERENNQRVEGRVEQNRRLSDPGVITFSGSLALFFTSIEPNTSFSMWSLFRFLGIQYGGSSKTKYNLALRCFPTWRLCASTAFLKFLS